LLLIGYQGIKGSNSEQAAKEIAQKMDLSDYRLIPLVSSFNVIENIINKTIDYGVVAMKNNTGGIVKESHQSLMNADVRLVEEVTLPIHHFLFVKNKEVTKDKITQIASHSQALIQCKNTLMQKYPMIPLIADEDTATAAIKLRIDLFDEYTAVLCRENAGIDNGLYLLDSYLEDDPGNTTDFSMFGLNI